jgi:PBP1b-binding outer membrane lipoprotein LpoB
MKRLTILCSALILAACSAEPGTDKWCEAKKEQPKSEWTGSDAATFAKNCIIDGMKACPASQRVNGLAKRPPRTPNTV